MEPNQLVSGNFGLWSDGNMEAVIKELSSYVASTPLRVPLALLGICVALCCSLVLIVRWKMLQSPRHPSNWTVFAGHLSLGLAFLCTQSSLQTFRVDRFKSFALCGLSMYFAAVALLLGYDFRRAPGRLFAASLGVAGVIVNLVGVLYCSRGRPDLMEFPIILGLDVYAAGVAFAVIHRMRYLYFQLRQMKMTD